MHAQHMARATISIPEDCLALVTTLVTKLGGQILNETSPDSPRQASMPEHERGGKTLKALRLQAGLTQKDVATTLGIPQSHISEFETDKRSIPYKHAQKLAALFNTLPNQFMRPNATTLEAMEELGGGKGKRSTSADALFDSLGI